MHFLSLILHVITEQRIRGARLLVKRNDIDKYIFLFALYLLCFVIWGNLSVCLFPALFESILAGFFQRYSLHAPVYGLLGFARDEISIFVMVLWKPKGMDTLNTNYKKCKSEFCQHLTDRFKLSSIYSPKSMLRTYKSEVFFEVNFGEFFDVMRMSWYQFLLNQIVDRFPFYGHYAMFL